jgi:hypothetical protein
MMVAPSWRIPVPRRIAASCKPQATPNPQPTNIWMAMVSVSIGTAHRALGTTAAAAEGAESGRSSSARNRTLRIRSTGRRGRRR